jgi:hypothetical protein
MSCIRTLALCAILVLVAALALPAAATTAVHMSDESLVDAADLIVVGTCQEVASRWVGRDLVTLATVEVAENVKGNAGSNVRVVLPGGSDTSGPVPVAVTWPGAPSMAPGEEVLLFLVEYPAVPGGYAVAGFSQGKFSIFEGPAGEARVSRDLRALTLVDGASRARGAERSSRLDEILGMVRARLAGQEVGR